MNAPENPKAFPFSREQAGSWAEHGGTGMSLRDWFAGQALGSMTVPPDYSKGPCNAAMAERAFVIADAMLAERAKKTP